ncbi:MAG: hypothetical protein ACLQGU_08455 [bacterium]
MTIMAFLLLSLNAYAQSDQKSAGTPPVSQTLIPEGDFALKLATALKLGTPNNEAQAEDLLTSAGIAPKNGWIADYPVTPNVIGELQNAVTTAADAKKLSMGKDEALKAFQGLTTEFGLAVSPESGPYAESQPPTSSEYGEPQEINDYYYDEGPPVVTYYPPPWDYYYLYGWVPYPFWCAGFFFPGFFVLNDFDIIVVGHHHHHFRVTNHFFDPRTHAFGRVDPVRHTLANVSNRTAFHSASTKNAAYSIFNRSLNSTGGRPLGNSNSRANGSGMNHQSSQGFARSSSSHSGGGSFSCANCHGGSSSFGGSSGHSFSGFSGGHSFGGFSGGGHGGAGGRR